jgi:small subunit ribosomal protein S4
MARETGPRHRACRRARQPLCQSKKCPADRRPYPPGQHGRARSKVSDYQVQLREKQKLRAMYGILERQFRRYYELATRQPGITGENLLRLLETRLDNVVWRAGFAATRPQARQLVNHGHFRVNGKKASIPSFQVKTGDVVSVRTTSHELIVIQHSIDTLGRPVPDWLEADPSERRITVRGLPGRAQIDTNINEQIIVELYSK